MPLVRLRPPREAASIRPVEVSQPLPARSIYFRDRLGARRDLSRPPEILERLCSRAAAIESGRIVQEGSWPAIAANPATPLLARLLAPV